MVGHLSGSDPGNGGRPTRVVCVGLGFDSPGGLSACGPRHCGRAYFRGFAGRSSPMGRSCQYTCARGAPLVTSSAELEHTGVCCREPGSVTGLARSVSNQPVRPGASTP